MFEVLTTDDFDRWLSNLADEKARTRIALRVARLGFGNPGDVKPIGDGLSEMRVHHGPGYRVIILCGGDKSSQGRDIKRAKAIAAEL
jgi:putative addiction module killer protein